MITKNLLRLILLTCILAGLTTTNTIAQSERGMALGDSLFVPHSSAIIELRSTEKGFLPTRMSTADRESIVDPAEGLLVYDSTENLYYYYFDTEWQSLGADPLWATDTLGNIYYVDGKVGIGVDSIEYDLHVEGLMKVEMGQYGFMLDTVSYFDLPLMGAFMFKNIDSLSDIGIAIVDASVLHESLPEDLLFISYGYVDETEDRATSIWLQDGMINMFTDSDEENFETTMMITKDGVAMHVNDLHGTSESVASHLFVGKPVIAMMHGTEDKHTYLGLDTMGLYMGYSDNTGGQGTVNGSMVNPSRDGLLLAVMDSTTLPNMLTTEYTVAGGWVHKSIDTTSQMFTLTNGINTELFYIKSNGLGYFSGDIGIGTDNPSEKLHVDGNILASGSITEFSDLRLKTNISPLSNALEKVLTLRGVTFDWKDRENNKKQMGLIAQDVEAVFPELVGTDNDGNKTLHYTGMIAPLVEAIKELNEELQRTRAKLAAMQSENATLNDRNADMESSIESLQSEMDAIRQYLEMQGMMR